MRQWKQLHSFEDRKDDTIKKNKEKKKLGVEIPDHADDSVINNSRADIYF